MLIHLHLEDGSPIHVSRDDVLIVHPSKAVPTLTVIVLTNGMTLVVLESLKAVLDAIDEQPWWRRW